MLESARKMALNEDREQYNWRNDGRFVHFVYKGPPDSFCDRMEYPSRKLDAVETFYTNIDRIFQKMDNNGLDCLNFLNEFNEHSSVNPVDTLLALGVNVMGSPDLEAVLENEQINEAIYKQANVQDITRDLLDLVHRMATTRTRIHHAQYFGNFISMLFQYYQYNGQKTRISSRMKDTFDKIDITIGTFEESTLFQWAYNVMTSHLKESENGDLELDMEVFKNNLQVDPLYRLLSLEGDEVANGTNFYLPQLGLVKSNNEQMCNPHLEYWGSKKRGLTKLQYPKALPILLASDVINEQEVEPPSHSTDREDNSQEELIKVKYLWQIFIQLLAMMVRSRLSMKDILLSKKKIVQPGLFVNNDKVHTCVLVMSTKTYQDFCNLDSVEETVKYLKQFAEDATLWCRLYVNFYVGDTANILQQCRTAWQLCGAF